MRRGPIPLSMASRIRGAMESFVQKLARKKEREPVVTILSVLNVPAEHGGDCGCGDEGCGGADGDGGCGG